MTFSRFLDRVQVEFPTVRSSRFSLGFLCLSSSAKAAGVKFASEKSASVAKGFSLSHLTLEFATAQIVIGMDGKRGLTGQG